MQAICFLIGFSYTPLSIGSPIEYETLPIPELTYIVFTCPQGGKFL